jgi:hypothetical protein
VVGRGAGAPLGFGLGAVPGGAEHGERSGSAGKEPAHTFGDNAEGFIARGAGLEQTAEFADLSDSTRLSARFFQQSANRLIGGEQFVLGRLALRDFLLLVILRERQTPGEGD